MSARNLHMELTSSLSKRKNKVFIFKVHVVAIENGIDDGTTITTINGCYHVNESIEKVLEMLYTR